MKPDIEIARSVDMERIEKIAAKIGIAEDDIDRYGKYIAKVPIRLLNECKNPKGNLILVTAMSPTRAGIGKTTVSVGLALGLNRIGKKAVVALREPSLGPCFGIKGGATGGGYAQIVPMEKINLHFTGDFHAVTSAHNLISAVLDNYLYQHQAVGFGLKKVLWKRVLDVNDRALRDIVIGLGPATNGVTRQSGFDITAASELMAILCLSEDLEDLEKRVGNILLGFTFDDKPFTVNDLGISGAVAVLMKAAINPNLVQTIEHTPAFIHGGPFANIAHGCNSVSATRMAMAHSDYAITEAGFGADLGAEKFFNIKCRQTGLQPKLTVLVATIQGLKIQGGLDYEQVKTEDVAAVVRGFENLDKHIRNLRSFGQTVVVVINKYASDTDAEIEAVRGHCEAFDLGFAVNEAFAKGGEGAEDFARLVVDTIEKHPSKPLQFTYATSDPLAVKIEKIAKNIYGAANVVYSPAARAMLKTAERIGSSDFPVCIAKTQNSFSTDPKRIGAADGFEMQVNDVIINSGSRMIVAVAGDILRMPGLPKVPKANEIRIYDGMIEGLS